MYSPLQTEFDCNSKLECELGEKKSIKFHADVSKINVSV